LFKNLLPLKINYKKIFFRVGNLSLEGGTLGFIYIQEIIISSRSRFFEEKPECFVKDETLDLKEIEDFF